MEKKNHFRIRWNIFSYHWILSKKTDFLVCTTQNYHFLKSPLWQCGYFYIDHLYNRPVPQFFDPFVTLDLSSYLGLKDGQTKDIS